MTSIVTGSVYQKFVDHKGCVVDRLLCVYCMCVRYVAMLQLIALADGLVWLSVCGCMLLLMGLLFVLKCGVVRC